MIDKIRTDKQYSSIMRLIQFKICKASDLGGFHNLPDKDAKELTSLNTLIQDYENKRKARFTSISELLQNIMAEENLTQRKLASKIGCSESQLSKIINRKQEPDTSFIKLLYKRIGINGDIILSCL